MQTSHLLTIAAAASLLTVGVIWHVLESDEPLPELLVPTMHGNSSREFLQEERRSTLRAAHVVETHQAVKTARASNAGHFHSAPVPAAIPRAYRPPIISAPSALPAARNHSAESIQDQPLQSAQALQSTSSESEFVPLYPPVGTGRIYPDPMILELDPGVKVPAAVLDHAEALTPAQAKAKELVTEEFADEIVKAAEQPKTNKRSNAASGVSEAAWLQAQRKADERYRSLFGDDAYNRATMQASLEAMR